MADGLADRDPQFDRLALGANRLNDYERGYTDSGDEAYARIYQARGPVPTTPIGDHHEPNTD